MTKAGRHTPSVKNDKVFEKRICLSDGCTNDITRTHGLTKYCKTCGLARESIRGAEKLARLRLATKEKKRLLRVKDHAGKEPLRCLVCDDLLTGRFTKFCRHHSAQGTNLLRKLNEDTEPFIVHRSKNWWKPEDKDIPGYYPNDEKPDPDSLVCANGYAKATDKM